MQPGKFRYRISIQFATETRNAAGEVVKVWNTILNGQRWASIEPISGKEGEVSGRISATVLHLITLRYMAGITPVHRVAYGARLFDINSVIDTDGRHIELQLFCYEAV